MQGRPNRTGMQILLYTTLGTLTVLHPARTYRYSEERVGSCRLPLGATRRRDTGHERRGSVIEQHLAYHIGTTWGFLASDRRRAPQVHRRSASCFARSWSRVHALVPAATGTAGSMAKQVTCSGRRRRATGRDQVGPEMTYASYVKLRQRRISHLLKSPFSRNMP